MTYLAENIRRLRQKFGYSLEKEAEIIGVSRQSLTKWENNITQPGIDKVIKLAELYNISLDELVLHPVEINISVNGSYQGNHFIERAVIDEQFSVHLSSQVQKVFNLKPGDSLLMMGDRDKGMIFLK